MNRREAISAVAFLFGGSVVGSNMFLTGCKNTDKKATGVNFDQDQIALLDEIAETIIPATTTPGAKAAKVGEFMTVMVKDCYEESNQEIFMEGLDKVNKAADKKYNKSFLEADATQRKALLMELDKEQKEFMKDKKADEPSHYFRMMKELTLLGYFTSEVGATQALRYVETPGRFDACIPYKKGDKAFA
ncbi:MAG: gluconate 2-dehydrogenase subunit 3 family protein [Chitinophagaceae bacterium]